MFDFSHGLLYLYLWSMCWLGFLVFCRYTILNPDRLRRIRNRELDMKPPYQFDEEDE